MDEIRIRKHIDSETLHLPELRPLIGKEVEIVVVIDPAAPTREPSGTIRKTPGVAGGNACVGDTRIPVWTLVQLHRLGRSGPDLLGDFPSLTRADLDAAWEYAATHPEEIQEAIAAQARED